MKHIITMTFIICGSLLVATPFIYAYLQEITIESLVDEFLSYVCVGAGIMNIVFGYKSIGK